MAISFGCNGNSNSPEYAILFLIILLFGARVCSCDEHPSASKRSNCLESERRALLAIKSDLYNSSHWLSSWIGYDCCMWRGVACDNTTNHVIRLDLHYPIDQYDLFPSRSKVNPSLFELKNLKYLNLSFNDFSTHVPSMISSLVHLEHLDLSYANFYGLIPQQLGNLSNLRSLDLSCCFYQYPNRLWSNDLSWLSHLNFLEYLDMSCVNLSTTINWLHQINYNSLEHLALSDCWSHDAIGADTNNLSSNQIEGNISVNATRKLKHLELVHNSLVKVPLNLENLFHLEYLDLSWNFITEEIHLSIGNLIHLKYLDLSLNYITGEIPLSMGNLVHLEYLALSGNHITGEMPLTMGKLSNLLYLDVSNNYLSSEVPNCRESYPIHLESLHLNNNNLSGPFPSFLKNCNQLGALDLGGNRFYGEIPKWVGRSFPWLKVLRLSSNSFSHSIPANIGNLTFLQVLDLSSNNFIGSIPSSIANFSSMSVKQNYTSYGFYHNKNNFRVDACNNSGSLYCIYSDIEYTEFDSLIITAKGLTNEYTKALSDVTSIDLSNNELSGEIPKEITKLHGLCFLNLSNNHLTGRIPENIGAITELQSLDLSMNRLTGEIPFNLSSLTFLSFLDLSYNNLSGRIPTGGQFSTFNDSIYAGNKGLCGVPLPQCPSDDADHPTSPIRENEDGDKLETILNYTFIVMGFISGFWAYFGMIIVKKSIKVTLFRLVDEMYDWIYVQLSLKIAKLNMKWQK